MSFMLMIVEPLGQRQERGLDAGKQAYARMSRFTADLQARGVWIASESLTGEDKGVRVQVASLRSEEQAKQLAQAGDEELVVGPLRARYATPARDERLDLPLFGHGGMIRGGQAAMTALRPVNRGPLRRRIRAVASDHSAA